jgi:replicative DNA helicase
MFLARSGVGKTWWAINVAANNRHVPTIFFSLEMQDRFLLQRLAAVHVQTRTVDIEEEIRETGASRAIEQTVEEFPLLEIVDRPEMSLKDMSRAIKEYEQQRVSRPELVIVDYLELVKSGMAMSSLEAVDNVSRAVKNWARTEDVAFIVLHQTNMNQAARVRDRWSNENEMDNGHLPLTRQAARFGGDVAADYTIGAYMPALAPTMEDSVREMRRNEFWMQLLKNRGGSQLYEGGVMHHVDTDHWRIT